MDFSELKNKNQAELQDILKDKQSELRHLRFGAHSGQLKQVSKFKEVKLIVSRIKTLLNSENK